MSWLAGLSPWAIYAVLGVLAAVENVMPPVPADTAVALGAFLSHRGHTTPLLVFLVVWISNIGGASGVYFAARRYGRPFFQGGLGARLLPPAAFEFVDREYHRYGIAGIFLSRFLPGIRAVVPPFAGLSNLSPARALIPMALASGIWYGAVTVAGAYLGAEWDRLSELVARTNNILAIVAVVVAVLAVAGYIWWRRFERRGGSGGH